MRIVCAILLLLVGVSLGAQVRVTTDPRQPPTAVIPAFDAVDKQALAFDATSEKQARAACDAIESAKAFRTYRGILDRQLKDKYPGYAMNWATKLLEPVPSVEKK